MQQERKEKMFQQGELPGRFMAKKLYGWSDKRYDQEYWGRMEKNWRQWKGKKPMKRKTIKTILEEKEIKEENQELENGQKKIMTIWATWSTHAMNCKKIPWDEKT